MTNSPDVELELLIAKCDMLCHPRSDEECDDREVVHTSWCHGYSQVCPGVHVYILHYDGGSSILAVNFSFPQTQ